jgi:2-methylisocitrate lyase-like PEP mutase family enzyme
MSPSNDDRSLTFRRLHAGPDMLLLANAWDAGSARLIESVGAKAIATTSAGVAWSHGYSDGSALPVQLQSARSPASPASSTCRSRSTSRTAIRRAGHGG